MKQYRGVIHDPVIGDYPFEWRRTAEEAGLDLGRTDNPHCEIEEREVPADTFTKNLHLIEVKYHGPTDARGSRVSLTSGRYEHRIYLHYDYAIGDIKRQALEWLFAHRFEPVFTGELPRSYVIGVEVFKSLQEAAKM